MKASRQGRDDLGFWATTPGVLAIVVGGVGLAALIGAAFPSRDARARWPDGERDVPRLLQAMAPGRRTVDECVLHAGGAVAYLGQDPRFGALFEVTVSRPKPPPMGRDTECAQGSRVFVKGVGADEYRAWPARGGVARAEAITAREMASAAWGSQVRPTPLPGSVPAVR